MADEMLLIKLRASADKRNRCKKWNEWRWKNRQVAINFSDSDLRGIYLDDVDLSGADLQGADLSGAQLNCADLRRANFREANLVRARGKGREAVIARKVSN